MLEHLSLESFRGLVGDHFRVRLAPEDVVTLALMEVSEQGRGTSSAQAGDFFALLFNGPVSRPLAQGTYAFEHALIGAFALFIVPIGAGSDGFRYEAVFSGQA